MFNNALPNLKDAMNIMPEKKKKVMSKKRVKALTETKTNPKERSADEVRAAMYGKKK